MEAEMKRILAALGATSLALLGPTMTASATPETSGGADKITICHATGSATNPYVEITVSLNALKGHAGSDHQNGEDIIPVNSGDVLPGGQNLDKMAWLDAGCRAPGGPPVTQPPTHENRKITICHATGSATNPFVVITVDLNALNGHAGASHQNGEDIIPPNSGDIVPGGQNWTAEGQAIFNNNCVRAAAPPVVPPTQPPVVPGVVPPAPSPGAGAAAGPRPAPAAGAAAAPAPVVNRGFDVQTAVTADPDNSVAPWAGALAAMILAAAAMAAQRKMAHGGTATSQRNE
jgi:hypothetical protein